MNAGTIGWHKETRWRVEFYDKVSHRWTVPVTVPREGFEHHAAADMERNRLLNLSAEARILIREVAVLDERLPEPTKWEVL